MGRLIRKIIFILLLTVLTAGALFLWGRSFGDKWQDTEEDIPIGETRQTQVRRLSTIQWQTMGCSLLHQSFLNHCDEKEFGTYVIPGLEAARTMRAERDDMCTSMTPQSVCVVDNLLLIGAYCHTGEHYSVIYVLDLKTHKYLRTIVLPGRHHVGGIAYDSIHELIWVSCYKKRAQACCFTREALYKYSYELAKRPIGFRYETDLYTIPRDSFMACYNGYLYIGYFQKDNESILQKFEIDKKTGDLKKQNSGRYEQIYGTGLPEKVAVPENVAVIDSKVQGLDFSEYRMFITESYGVGRSRLAMFSIKDDDDSDQRYVNDNAIAVVTLPQKLEQITVSEHEMYSIYESGAYAYRFYSHPVIDRVIKMRVKDVRAYERDNR